MATPESSALDAFRGPALRRETSWLSARFRGHILILSQIDFLPQQKTHVIIVFFCFLINFWFRGIRPANAIVTMNVTGQKNSNTGDDTGLSNDWVQVHADYLFNFAIGQVRDAGVAEELVQETFLAVLKSKSNFSGRSSEQTWLVGILRHKIYDHLRKTCRERAIRVEPVRAIDEQSLDESVLWLHDVATECQSPSRRMELGEFRRNLEIALGKLPPRIAQVFQLYAIEELSNREVCEQLNISESNLWVMLHRGRNQLREHLSEWGVGGR